MPAACLANVLAGQLLLNGRDGAVFSSFLGKPAYAAAA